MKGDIASGGKGPLEGITVIDFTSYIAGPYAAMMLADLGAGVIKVEPPEGDSFRELPGFYGWNRGKRSVVIDLKHPEGGKVVRALLQSADVVVENMRPGATQRLGIDYDGIYSFNPGIVYCSITAFGSGGPCRDRPGFDPLLQAMGGIMTLQGFGGPPQYVRIAIVDYYAAALACQAVLAALFSRQRNGPGQRVETSLLQAALALQSGNIVDYRGKRSVFRDNPTYRLYQAADASWFFLACGNTAFWVRLCETLGRPDLAKDPRYATWISRLDNGKSLIPVLEAVFASRSRAEWLRILGDRDIPCASVQSLEEFMADDAVRYHQMTVRYDHPEVGDLTLMGVPQRFSRDRTTAGGPPPLLGQHTREVLREIGFEDEEISHLHRERAVWIRP